MQHLKEWLKLDREQRVTVPFTPEMATACGEFYFNSYARHFSSPVFRDALACIPSLNMLDDHDIFDGDHPLPLPPLPG